MAAEHAQLLNRPIDSYDRFESNYTLHAYLPGQRGLHGPHLTDQLRGLHVSTDDDLRLRFCLRLSRWHGRRRRRRAHQKIGNARCPD